MAEKKYFKKALSLLLMLAMIIVMTCVSGDEVHAATKKIVLAKSSYSVNVGKTVTVKINTKKTTSSLQKKGFTYKSSNTKIATVSSKGEVKGKKAGTVTITVTSKSDKKIKATCKVKVSNDSGSNVTVYQVYCAYGDSQSVALYSDYFYISGSQYQPIRTADLSSVKNKMIGQDWYNLKEANKTEVSFEPASNCVYSWMNYDHYYDTVGKEMTNEDMSILLSNMIVNNSLQDENGEDFLVLVYVKNNKITRISIVTEYEM